MTVQAERGFVILASNTETTDYVRCATQLARSLRHWSQYPVCIVTNDPVPANTFDYVVPWPRALLPNAFANDWQAWLASPFRQSIKLESDMLITSNIDHWWDMMQLNDVVVSTGARDYRDQPAASRYYRKTFDQNNLPDVYNAITYWRLSRTAQEFFDIVRSIFEHWDNYKTLLKFPDEVPTTDLVYAMAAQIIGPDRVTQPWATYPRMVHMKQHIVSSVTRDWTQEFVWEHHQGRLRINTVTQWGAFHYNIKDWNPYERNN